MGKLITRYEDILVEEWLRLETKDTKYEYTKKIGIIIEPNLQFASKPVYENKMYTQLKETEKTIKTRKDYA